MFSCAQYTTRPAVDRQVTVTVSLHALCTLARALGEYRWTLSRLSRGLSPKLAAVYQSEEAMCDRDTEGSLLRFLCWKIGEE